MTPRQRKLRHAMALLAAAAVLALVFAAYLSPHLVVDLATRLWSCF